MTHDDKGDQPNVACMIDSDSRPAQPDGSQRLVEKSTSH
jgi:hypothetical protein